MKTSFHVIGLHLDLRVQVPPLPALLRIAREAAEFGINTLIMEWEASFPFQRHAVISSGLAYTEDEMAQFHQECGRLGLEVIPLQQCFGHVEYVLRHPRYASLRESEADLCQVCPCKEEEALSVFSDLFAEVAAQHPSPYFHIGGDETTLLGHCPACHQRVRESGKSQLYVSYFANIARQLVAMGKRPLLWADMLLRYPEAAAQMPPECIFIDWNYGWAVDRFGDFEGLSSLPFEFWGAVAMRSAPDNHSSYHWQTHFNNFRDYPALAAAKGFRGMVLTSWSTSGVYGYEWENSGKPLALYPVRRVTPHAGLRVMVAAFCAALEAPEKFDGQRFLHRYAMERFGWTPEEAALFCRAVAASDPSRTPEGAKADSDDILTSLHPRSHPQEFERYRLMLRLTAFQERVALLEAQMHETNRSATFRTLRETARQLLKEGAQRTEEFDQLYRDELYPAERMAEADYRMKRLTSLAGGPLQRPTPSAATELLARSRHALPPLVP